jgi:ribosomal protein L37E
MCGKRSSVDETLQSFYAKHGNKYTYPSNLSEYKSVRDKIPIFCPVKDHGIFYQMIMHHKRGKRCPKCGFLSISRARTLNRNAWIERFDKVHGKGKYDYSKLPENPGADEEFPIYCAVHDFTFYQTPSQHIYDKHGCRKCGIVSRVEKQKACIITRMNFINRAQAKNGLGYEYINLPKEFSLNDTIGIFCAAHNKLFFCTGHEHLEGKGCPECEVKQDCGQPIKVNNL